MLSIIIPAYNEEVNLRILLPKLRAVLSELGGDYEIIIADASSTDQSRQAAEEAGARFFIQQQKGYGAALKEAFLQAKGDYLITLDADFSHDPAFIKDMWGKRKAADLVIASRYVKGGGSDASLTRKILSIVLNRFFAFALSLPIKDLSSGFRMYRKEAVENIKCDSGDYSFLEELAIKLYGRGYRVAEVPFHYRCRRTGKSHIKLLQFGVSYCFTLVKMWRLRNSIFFADYDERAFDSKIPLQRFWQRRRFEIIIGFIRDKSAILDIGCGTSRIIGNLPEAVGLDIELFKLRYLTRQGKKRLVQADIKQLPFKDGAFRTVICSEVIEHVGKSEKNFREMLRVLKGEGELILGTPDYNSVIWNIIEWFYKLLLPGAYGEGHISRYTYRELAAKLEAMGFSILDCRYILASEMIIRAKKVI